jgi:hypothetical protein
MGDKIQPALFADDAAASERRVAAGVERARAAGVARVLWSNRSQILLRPCDLESLLPEGHRARLVWAWVERANLRAIYGGFAPCKASAGPPPKVDPENRTVV